MGKHQLSIYLTIDQIRQVEKKARALGLSQSGFVSAAITKFLESKSDDAGDDARLDTILSVVNRLEERFAAHSMVETSHKPPSAKTTGIQELLL